MRHAEAHEQLADLALEPGRLRRFETDQAPGAVALRAHVQTCRRCAADLAGWRRTWSEAGAALEAAAREPVLEPPAGLRDRILEIATHGADAPVAGADSTAPTPQSMTGRSVRARQGSRPPVPRAWLAAAAAIVLAIGGVTVGWIRQGEADELRAQTARLQAELDSLRTEAGELRAVAAAFDRILATQRHWVVTLRTADGTPGGTLAWTASEIVMVASDLPAPAVGQDYRCWVEDATGRSPMGPMALAGATGYWVSSMDPWRGASWADAVTPGLRFGVSLVPEGGTGTPVLIGEL